MPESTTNEQSLIANAQELHQLGLLPQALAAYNKALKLAPKNASLLLQMGQLQQDLDQHGRAANYFERAIKADPSHVPAYIQLAISLTRLARIKEAITACRKAIELEPNLFEAHYQLASLLAHANEHDLARQAYQNALRLNPSSASVHYNLGVLDQIAMKPAHAINHYRQALAFAPDHVDAMINLSVALCETGQTNEAKRINDKALSLNPSVAQAHFNAHTHWIAQGQMQQAIESLRRALALEPNNEKYQAFLGVVLDYAGQHDQANAFLTPHKPSKLYKADIQAWQFLSQQPKQPKMLAHAYAVFEYALQQARTDGLVLEFGVYHGTSINQIAALTDATVHGFDSFQGIPQAWNSEPAGSYSTEGELPTVAANVQLHAGWFTETIAPFLLAHSEPVRLMNIDCDLHSSTETVLSSFHDRIGAGTVLVFDEFIGNESWQDDEFKAFEQAAERYNWRYEVLCFCFMTKQVAIRITGHAEPAA